LTAWAKLKSPSIATAAKRESNLQLKNFDIPSSVELVRHGLFWDLHNCAYFEGLELIPSKNAVAITWSVLAARPWGGPKNEFAGVQLFFDNVSFLHVGLRDHEMPMREDSCVSAILKVDPNAANDDPPKRPLHDLAAHFRLAFVFCSQRIIELESETVELVPLTEIGDDQFSACD
jgi:hypothetical protein